MASTQSEIFSWKSVLPFELFFDWASRTLDSREEDLYLELATSTMDHPDNNFCLNYHDHENYQHACSRMKDYELDDEKEL